MSAIQDNNILYNILSPLVQFGTRCHYHHFVVRGKENLPTDGAYIFAPCHQQALMEPLAVLVVSPRPTVFLARADIFQKPLIRRILTFLKILPVYRIRDGQSNLAKNNDIFDRSRDVLLDGYPLCLMAEGRHNNRHHLLPMGKGMFRIAGETQLKLGDHPLYIVPTGIDFDDYERPYANLVVNIGKAIPVQKYMEEYHDNEPVALNAMRHDLASALSPLMHDIRHEEYYDEIFTLCTLLCSHQLKLQEMRDDSWNRFATRQHISRRLDTMLDAQAAEGVVANDEVSTKVETMAAEGCGTTDSLLASARAFGDRCRELHLRPTLVPDHWGALPTALAALLFLALLAVAIIVPVVRQCVLFCLLCYPFTFLPTHLIFRRVIGDSQFRSSVNFGVRFLTAELYGLVISIIMACTGGMWMGHLLPLGPWWGLVAVAVVFLGAILSAPVVNGLRGILANCGYWWKRLTHRKAMHALDGDYKRLAEAYDSL